MIEIRENIDLKEMTTFKIGGAARFFTRVISEEEIKEALQWARSRGIPHIVLSGGSNVLVPDEGLEALVLHIDLAKFVFAGTRLTADAGCNLLDLIRKASVLGLGGWEKLAGIPGTVGGAIRGNAGAFGTEIKDVVVHVRGLNANTFEIREFASDACEFSYRMSYFKRNSEWIITRVQFQLQKVHGIESAALCEETIRERERRHLQDVQAAGSYFMNPIAPDAVVALFEREKGVKSRENRVPAGWLIERAGMKGAKVGDALASEQHPNYIVNAGNATSAEVLELSKKIKDAVREQFGIELEEEAVVFAK